MINIETLNEVLVTEERYRRQQVHVALCRDSVSDWDQASVLPLSLRKKLNEYSPIDIAAQLFPSQDRKTVKALLELDDGERVETVLMRHQDGRNTVCVSCQVGCPMGCEFCATGTMGFVRNLSVGEIISQVLVFCRLLKGEGAAVTNIVFMGMGEPFNNYDAVLQSVRLFNSSDAFNIGARRMAVSTSGIVPGIDSFADEKLQVNLAISLHAPTDALRTRLMPINKVYPIADVLAAVDRYLAKTSRRVMFEYLMIEGVNDSEKDAQHLAKLLKKPLYLVNIIKYNETGKYRASTPLAIKRFITILQETGIPVTERYRFGHDISAACGQLATTIKNKNKKV